MQADSCADVDAHSCSDVDAHFCSDIDSYALADRHTDACADVDSYALADRHAHACADVHVRACLHAPYHARCGLTRTGMHDDACACPRPRTQSWARAHNVTELFTPAPGPRWDGTDTGAHPRAD